MPQSSKLWCCSNFMPELKAALEQSERLNDVDVEVCALRCRADGPLALGAPPSAEGGVIAGGCLRGMPARSPHDALVLAPDHYFELLAPKALIDSLLAGGAYLTTPGWLARWADHLAHWGFDRPTARAFFHETTRELVLLDTLVDASAQGRLAEMARYLELPHRAIPVGLDMLVLSLENMLLGRSPAKAMPAPDRIFADHLMFLDIMNYLLDADSEVQAVGRAKDMCVLLFAPKRLEYQPGGSDDPPGQDYAWTASGRGFSLNLRHRGRHLGNLVVDELTFAEYKDRYLTLALPMARICAMAIHNARANEKSRLAQQALRDMAGIVASSDDAIIGKTLDGFIVSWNQGAAKTYGYDEAEMLGRHISLLTPRGRPDEMPRMLQLIANGESIDQVETVWLAKDGRETFVSLQVSPIRDDAGRVVGASSIARDISKEKEKQEAERRSLEEQLIQAQKLESVGRLAGGVAHDFNNVLAIILGYSDLALDDLPRDNELFHEMTQIRQAAERGRSLTGQLLAFARRQVLQKAVISLNEIVGNFASLLDRLLGEDIKIKMAVSPDLPMISADASMMEQILLNLAVNARDAMPDGGTLTIETALVSLDQNYARAKFEVVPGEYVMLAVSDTGVGMDERTCRAIFEPFFTTKGPTGGTGLGLSTVYGIVKQHDGNIWVYSEPGQGTTLKIYLPVERAAAEAAAGRAEVEPAPAMGQCILMVEDDPGLREFICLALQKLGYRVLPASGAAQARELSRAHPGDIDLMLTDVVMQDMNGKALYESIAPQRPEMRVIFMSGYTENVIAHRGVLQEGIKFLQKPFSIKQLAAAVGAVLAEPAQPSRLS